VRNAWNNIFYPYPFYSHGLTVGLWSSNHEWTIQRPWQHWGQDTNQRQTKQLNTTQKIKNISKEESSE
jgi:hypothetical protein